MAQEDEYTAIGPAQSDSGMPFAAFSSRATGMEYGANLQGDRAGIYAESVNGPTTRVPQFGKAGVYGVGDNFGVVGETTSIGAGAEVAGVWGRHHRGGLGVVGSVLGEGTAVAGISDSSINAPTTLPNPSRGTGTGVYGTSGTGRGVWGTSRAGAGVQGESEDGDAVVGKSTAARGGVFQSGTSGAGAPVGQIGLVPHPMPVPGVVRAVPTMLDPRALTGLPPGGQGGDLLVTQAPDGRCTLWFCVLTGDGRQPAQWREVLLGEFAGQSLVQIAWPGRVVSVSGTAVPSQGPENALGAPNGSAFVASPGVRATFGGFLPVTVPDLTNLINGDTVTAGDVPSPGDLVRADLIAFERNGGSPATGGGWESCDWTFADGLVSVAVSWDGDAGATRDPHIVANGSVPGAAYTNHFAITFADPASAIPPGEVISFLVFSLPELDVESAAFTSKARPSPRK